MGAVRLRHMCVLGQKKGRRCYHEKRQLQPRTANSLHQLDVLKCMLFFGGALLFGLDYTNGLKTSPLKMKIAKPFVIEAVREKLLLKVHLLHQISSALMANGVGRLPCLSMAPFKCTNASWYCYLGFPALLLSRITPVFFQLHDLDHEDR